jgi:outer membrane receptor protein involved in Fe transport
VFGSVTVDIMQGLELSAELRYAEEVKTIIDRASATSIFCAGEGGRAGQFGFTAACLGRAKFSGTDPRVTLNYTTPGGTCFTACSRRAQTRRVQRHRGPDRDPADRPGLHQLPAEKSTGGEFGVKFDAFDRRLRIAAAAFYNKLSDVQLTSAIPNPTGPAP